MKMLSGPIKGEDIDKLFELGFENYLLGSLISSDSITSIEQADKALLYIKDLNEAVDESTISDDKKEWMRGMLKKMIDIINADIKRFKKEM